MREIRTSGSMSGEGKRGGALREYPRPSSTLPWHASGVRDAAVLRPRDTWFLRFKDVESREPARAG